MDSASRNARILLNKISISVLFCLSFASLVHAGQVKVRVYDSKGAPVSQAVVSLHPLDAAVPPVHGKPTAVMDQKGFSFVPQVLPVRAGTLVDFPNSDQVRHHVYSFSKAKRFQLRLYSGEHAPPVLFDKPGVVVMGCNIHDWMLGYIYVLDTPYFAKSSKSGEVRLAGIPAGRYALRLWHPRLDGADNVLSRTVEVPVKGRLDEQFDVKLHPPELSNQPPRGLDIGAAGNVHAGN